ncbi:Nonribosomal peptide synthetase (fragment) [Frankia canadensis]|uniref:Nonribosomal peptide synthetase n=1 Tax=Frankia canadensis TaxID=1836972 RepID=A0A2I2L292_9ACTN
MREVLARLATMTEQERADFLTRARPAAGPTSAARSVPTNDTGPSVRVRQDGRSAVSFAQEQHLFLDHLWSGSTAYLVPFALRLRGPLSVDALREAMRDVVGRHDVLRSHFVFEDGVPVQVVDPDWRPVLRVRTAGGTTLPERERAAEDHGAELAHARFDLRTGPLLRTELLELEPENHVLLWIAHHAVADGWSVGVLIEDLGAAYRARLAGQPLDLPPLPLQFGDFAEWQRERLAGPRLAELVNRWRDRLSNAPAAAVPTDRVRPAVQTFRGSTLTFALPAEVTAGLTALSSRSAATLFSVLLSALHVLVARHSGEPDAVTGVVLTGRVLRETEPLIGPFANTLPLRVDASADPAFSELLAQVKEAVLDGLADQGLPFGRLVKELGHSRDISRNPLYQVLFSMGSLPLGTGDVRLAPGLSLRPVGLPNGTSRLDLEFTMEQTGDTLSGRLDYNTDLFERNTAQRLVDQFRTLLAAITTNPDRPVSRYPLLAEHEQRRALERRARADRPALATGFLDLFARQVGRRPDEIAVRCGNHHLSYRELDALSDRIAHAVLARTRGPEPVVAVGTGRTPDLLPAILGILKAGGTYLPLELEHPPERLAYMLDDSGAELLIIGTESLPPLPGPSEPAGPERAVLRLDQLPAATGPADVPPDLDRLVYVMYTSGSTGRPKGVAVQHRALANFLGSMADLGMMAPGDVTVALASLPFDGSVIELFLPLAVGATVVVGQRADAKDGSRLLRLLAEHQVTVLHGTPSTWRLLLDAGAGGLGSSDAEHGPEAARGRLGPLRRALSGGEALPAGLARELRTRVPEVWNLYGPAETTVYSLAQLLTSDTTPLIGRPIAGTTAHVLDEWLRPVPPGVLGELYLGGAGLAREYLNLPELTAERFITHPVTGERLYRTGDLFRHHDDGSLTFHGRRDHQVKLRGHRIELGEVETALARHPAIREAVVMLREFAANDQRLLAYVRPRAETTAVPEAELKALARTSLPSYMVPSRVICLPGFPLNNSGKVDRRALDGLPLAEADPSELYQAPETSTQQWLADLWSELLSRDRVGVDEDFFAAGGHSLLAIKLLHRVREDRGVEVALDSFLSAPTIAGLAGQVDEVLSPDVMAALERQVDTMTDEEVAALLSQGEIDG